ncbi:MAG: hypothetical protein LC785_09185 [Acidobacteria bacterium]|nr:hypothetical protein [Acidobacteriota bacterium]
MRVATAAATGRNITASRGSVRVAASKMRRRTTPHPPPERWCSMISASEPTAAPVQNVNATRYGRQNASANPAGLRRASATAATSATTPTTSAVPPTRSRARGTA